MIRSMMMFACVLGVGSIASVGGCDKKPDAIAPVKPSGAANTSTPAVKQPAIKADDHAHAPGEKHDGHDHSDGDKHDDHGPTVELGSSTIGSFQVKASRDGEIKAGGELPVDLWLTPSAGVKVGAVRAWIGTQDAKGSMKAKMGLEKDNYHNHVEVPNPLPAGAMLWVEIEDEKGVKTTGSFALKS